MNYIESNELSTSYHHQFRCPWTPICFEYTVWEWLLKDIWIHLVSFLICFSCIQILAARYIYIYANKFDLTWKWQELWCAYTLSNCISKVYFGFIQFWIGVQTCWIWIPNPENQIQTIQISIHNSELKSKVSNFNSETPAAWLWNAQGLMFAARWNFGNVELSPAFPIT